MTPLHALLEGLPVRRLPADDPDVRGLTHDSRRVGPGDLYVALAGERFDGRRFAADAGRAGAVAVVGDGPPPLGLALPWVDAEAPRRLLGPLAARLHRHPDAELTLVGVTGTNGKSTIVALVAAALVAAGRPAGQVGTLGYVFRDRVYEGERTTPEASDFFRILRSMRDDGAEALAMEVSSHALALGRVDGAAFDVALFTNLTHDHLDFHGDLESYFAAKRSLFERLKPGGRAVVCLADPWGRRLAAELAPALGDRLLTYGAGGAVAVEEVACDLAGIRGRLRTPRGPLAIESPLLGAYNLENLLAAVAVGEALALPPAAVARGLAGRGPLPGRLEPVASPGNRGGSGAVGGLVDYAHTPAALEAALGSLRGLTARPIVVVFGCGGDRDRAKRPVMGRIAGELAEVAIATSDNPRSEDPLAILAEVEVGLREAGNPRAEVEPDRRQAIRRAVWLARHELGDGVVLVAGKGHEREQLVGDRRLPFDDRRELAAALAAAAGGVA